MKHYRDDQNGRGNHCIELHQCFLFLSLLDLRVFSTLVNIITEDEFGQLKENIFALMIEKLKSMSNKRKFSKQKSVAPGTTNSTKAESKKHVKVS